MDPPRPPHARPPREDLRSAWSDETPAPTRDTVEVPPAVDATLDTRASHADAWSAEVTCADGTPVLLAVAPAMRLADTRPGTVDPAALTPDAPATLPIGTLSPVRPAGLAATRPTPAFVLPQTSPGAWTPPLPPRPVPVPVAVTDAPTTSRSVWILAAVSLAWLVVLTLVVALSTSHRAT